MELVSSDFTSVVLLFAWRAMGVEEFWKLCLEQIFRIYRKTEKQNNASIVQGNWFFYKYMEREFFVLNSLQKEFVTERQLII